MSIDSYAQTLRQPISAIYLGLGAYSTQQADVFSFVNNQAALAQIDNATVGVYGEKRFLLNETSLYAAALAIPSSLGNFGVSKVKSCEEVGFKSTLIRLDADVEEAVLISAVEQLNNDADVDGILVQLPLPKQISEEKIINLIHPDKDVDGFHPMSIGKMVLGQPAFIPATPYGILLMLEHYNIETKGKHAVIIGRSNIVGRPISILLNRNAYPGNCTVTVCHSHTPNLKEMCLQADIIVAALGKPQFLTADMVKENAVVVDVGITRVADATKKSGFAIKGDVDFANVAPKCSYITPVPGGVGLMTIAALLMNTYNACLNK